MEKDRISWDVTLDDLEVLALLMLLHKQEGELSEPAASAMEKLKDANYVLQNINRLAP